MIAYSGKLKVYTDNEGNNPLYCFYCPGCKRSHPFDSRWSFNGDFNSPTFEPSLLVNQHDPKVRCHSFVRNGTIQFLDDCHHELKGHTVTVPDWPEDCF